MNAKITADSAKDPKVATDVLHATALTSRELDELCDATEAAIEAGGGFGWLTPPPRAVLERFWSGVLLIPERNLFIAKLDGVVCGSVQLQKPPRNSEATAFAVRLTTFFLAPWARGYGLARPLVEIAEKHARAEGFLMINLDVRETQEKAIQLYEGLGFECWGTNPGYARVDNKMVAGHYYSKALGNLKAGKTAKRGKKT